MDTRQDPKTTRAAIRNFRRLLELEPRNRGYREQLARLYEADERPRDAQKEWLGLARDLLLEGDTADAIESAHEALRVEPGHEETLSFLAGFYAHAARGALVPRVTAVVDEDPLDEMARPEADAPLDASQLLAVHSPEDVGAELASQSVSSLDASVGSGRVTMDFTPVVELPESGTLEIGDEDLESLLGEPQPPPVRPPPVRPPPEPRPATPIHGAPPIRSPRALTSDDPAGTIDVDVELFSTTTEWPGSSEECADLAPAPSPVPVRASVPEIPLFGSLPRATLADILLRADRRYFPEGAALCCAGEPADGLYVVLSGAARLVTTGAVGEVEVAVLEAGAFFGEVDLLGDAIFGVSALAIEPVEVLKVALDKVTFLRRHFPAFERALDVAAEHQTVVRLLARSMLFGGLPPRDRAALAGRFRPIALAAGEELFCEGSPPGGLYLVTRGVMDVYREGTTISQVRNGEFLGVAAMLHQSPATCTALAGPSVQVVCLDPEELDLVLSSWQVVREAFWREARTRAH